MKLLQQQNSLILPLTCKQQYFGFICSAPVHCFLSTMLASLPLLLEQKPTVCHIDFFDLTVTCSEIYFLEGRARNRSWEYWEWQQSEKATRIYSPFKLVCAATFFSCTSLLIIVYLIMWHTLFLMLLFRMIFGTWNGFRMGCHCNGVAPSRSFCCRQDQARLWLGKVEASFAPKHFYVVFNTTLVLSPKAEKH